jgi:hypothetical protein
VNRPFPFTVRVAALQAAMRLTGSLVLGERAIDLGKLFLTDLSRNLARILTLYVQKLKIIV